MSTPRSAARGRRAERDRDVVDQTGRADEGGERDQRVAVDLRRPARAWRRRRPRRSRGAPAARSATVSTSSCRDRRRVALGRRPPPRDATCSAPESTVAGGALVGREVGVAARHREAVGLADERAADDRRPGRSRSAVMRRITASCWASLRPKYARHGTDDREQLGDDGGDTVEVRRAAGAAQPVGEPVDVHGRARRRPGTSRRPPGTNSTSTPSAAATAASPSGSRGYAARSSVGAELRRVHEQAHDDEVVVGARRAHQRAVAFVEEAHRGHEPDASARARARRRTRRGPRRSWRR